MTTAKGSFIEDFCCDSDEDDQVEQLLKQGQVFSHEKVQEQHVDYASTTSSNKESMFQSDNNSLSNSNTIPIKEEVGRDVTQSPVPESTVHSDTLQLSEDLVAKAHKQAKLFVTEGLSMNLKDIKSLSDLCWYQHKGQVLPCFVCPKNDVKRDLVNLNKSRILVQFLGKNHYLAMNSTVTSHSALRPFHNNECATEPDNAEDCCKDSSLAEIGSNEQVWSPKFMKLFTNHIKKQKKMTQGEGLMFNVLVEKLILKYLLIHVREQIADNAVVTSESNKIQEHLENSNESTCSPKHSDKMTNSPAVSATTPLDIATATTPLSPGSKSPTVTATAPPDIATATTPLSQGSRRGRMLRLTQFQGKGKKRKLRAGDIVKYVEPTKRATNENMRVAAIVKVFSNGKDDSDTDFALALSDGQLLTSDCQVRVTHTLRHGKFEEQTDTRFQQISDFVLDTSNNDRVKLAECSTYATQLNELMSSTLNAKMQETG